MLSIRDSESKVKPEAAPLPRAFYSREPKIVAGDLIGKRLVRRLGSVIVTCRIVEAEAYRGPDDDASHARHGRTRRNFTMFGPPGHAYVYFVYGIHWMFNVVAHTDRSPGAILIRAVEPLGHHDILQAHRGERVTGRNLTNGPAKLAQALDITGDQNDVDLCSSQDLTIVEGALAVGETLAIGRRVRVPGGEDAQTRPWRFWIAGSRWVSR